MLCGTLIEKSVNDAVISCGGVGFQMMIPTSVYGMLPERGNECTIYTHLAVKEDSLVLFGFSDERQRAAFRQLLGVSGVGPKSALAIISLYEPDRIAIIVAAGDYKSLTACSGVGPKLAQRIILELKDKVGALGELNAAIGRETNSVSSGAGAQALAALVSLGFSNSEAAIAIAALPAELSTEELIGRALKSLG